MNTFLFGIVLLFAGYILYGSFIEGILAPDDRPTPAVRLRDGVDFVVLPHWKNMLIQLLNIAGVGPVIGVILGIKFGPIVFLIIPIGNVIGGAVHDFISGMMSLRSDGANLPTLIRDNLGKPFFFAFSLFTVFLLLLVVAVFINVPAHLIDALVPGKQVFWLATGGIFAYYLVATLFPVDKIIGKLYPLFGALLLVGTVALFYGILMLQSFEAPLMMEAHVELKRLVRGFLADHPVLPCLFVTIACGILSGFHATQSPIIARTMATERQARSSFYGMMIVEGIIAMIWAAAAFAIYNRYPEYFALNANDVLVHITSNFLGSFLATATVVAVIVLAITSGDTALRSLRLTCAEILHIDQTRVAPRLFITVPLALVVAALLAWSNTDATSFNHLWNYFAWGNQVLAVCTLSAGSVWLFRQRKNGWIALLPGMFMMFIVVTYILWTSPAHKGPYGCGLPLGVAYAIGIAAAILLVPVLLRLAKKPAAK